MWLSLVKVQSRTLISLLFSLVNNLIIQAPAWLVIEVHLYTTNTVYCSLCIIAGQGIIEPNAEFEITKISELADISNWSHHVNYILPQGRTVWWNPVQKADDEFEEEEEEDEEKEQPDEPEPETGPPLLTSAAEDERE